MKRRPVCTGAVLLVAVLLIGRCFGAPETAPYSSRLFAGEVSLSGKVSSWERTSGGFRFYLTQSEIQSVQLRQYSKSNQAVQLKQYSKSNPIFQQTQSFQDNQGSQLRQSLESNQGFETTQSSQEDQNYQPQKLPGRIQVYLKASSQKLPTVGSWIMVSGRLELPQRDRNPGQFNARAYNRVRNVFLILKDARILQTWERSGYRNFLSDLRERMRRALEQALGKEKGGVVAAIALGEKSGLSGEVKRLYQEGGIAHLLAISSLHISLLGMGIYRILRRYGCPFLGAGLISGSFLVSFCIFSGISVSAVRACIMFLLWLGSQVTGRKADGFTSASVAATATLVFFSPEYLWDSSFLLSFGCILSLWLLPPLARMLLPIPGRIGAALQSSAALQLGTLPIVLYFFYQATPYGILVNFLVIPFLELLMVSGLLGSLAGMFSPPLGAMLAAPCRYLVEWFELVCKAEGALPWAVVITGRPALWQVGGYYGILFFLLWQVKQRDLRRKGEETERHAHKETRKEGWGKKRSYRSGAVRNAVYRFGVIGFFAFGTALLSFRSSPQFRVTVLDVGQGDSILIESGGRAFLIDGGSSSVQEVWQYRMESTLKYYGIRRLDGVFLSHGDWDHISGICQFLEGYKANLLRKNGGSVSLGRIFLPDAGKGGLAKAGEGGGEDPMGQIRRLAGERGIPISIFPAGASLTAGELCFTCLAPDGEQLTGDSNQDSMVLLLEYGEAVTGLFTGDLEGQGEKWLLERLVKRGKEEQQREEKGKNRSMGQGKEAENLQGMERQKREEGQENHRLDFLKVGHHGSKNASAMEFLEFFKPEVALISAGENNRYGHPSPEVLQRLGAAGTRIYRTDQGGAITGSFREGKLIWSTWLRQP